VGQERQFVGVAVALLFDPAGGRERVARQLLVANAPCGSLPDSRDRMKALESNLDQTPRQDRDSSGPTDTQQLDAPPLLP
jgi:hypothetical protein